MEDKNCMQMRQIGILKMILEGNLKIFLKQLQSVFNSKGVVYLSFKASYWQGTLFLTSVKGRREVYLPFDIHFNLLQCV